MDSLSCMACDILVQRCMVAFSDEGDNGEGGGGEGGQGQ